MRSVGLLPHLEAQQENYVWRGFLFYVTFLYFTVGITPFTSLATTDSGTAMAAGSNLINQLIALALLISFLIFMVKERSFSLFFQPRILLLLIFSWYALTSIIGEVPIFSLRRLVMCAIVCVLAGFFLQLPRSERHFATLLAGCVIIILTLSYLGVLVLPSRSIHQASDALEPFLAGDWRGVFAHKNEAAVVMALLVMVGLYLCKRWSTIGGSLILLGSAIFLWKSGGKTALGLIPLVLLVGWFIVQFPLWRYFAVLFLVGGFAIITVGTTVDPEFSQRLTDMGLDASFTGRTDIWSLAIDNIQQNPIFGYGYQAFWRSDALLNSIGDHSSWAKTAPSAHSGYLDLLLFGGFPGLGLVMIWLCLLPLYNLGKMRESVRKSPLTFLYIGIWLHVLLYGFLETTFLMSSGFGWFIMLVAVMGLHLQATANIVEADQH